MNENTVGRRTALAEQSARKQSEKMFETARMEDLAVLDKRSARLTLSLLETLLDHLNFSYIGKLKSALHCHLHHFSLASLACLFADSGKNDDGKCPNLYSFSKMLV